MKRAARTPRVTRARNTFDHARWLRETQRRLAFRATWQKYFESHDVFLLPSSFTAAFAHDHSEPMGKRVMQTPEGKRPYMQNAAVLDLDRDARWAAGDRGAVGLTDAGLPVGIQIIAPMWEDGTSIEFAALMSELTGGFRAPPGY